ncbi:MAG: carbonic anhydrase [Planctomycetaceae bacterium]
MHPDDRPVFFESSAPFERTRIRAAAVYCSDGRFGEQFDDLLQNALQLPRYDRLAVPGGSACLARHFATYREEEGVFEQLRFLVSVHGLERVVLIAHENCAFYSERLCISPLQLESQQREDMQKAVRRVRSLSSTLAVSAFFARTRGIGTVQFEEVDL